MSTYEDEILEKIDSDVRSNSELVTKRVNEETEYMLEEEVGFYKEGLKKETDTYLETELNDLRLQAATRTSQARLDIKKKLLEKREDLTLRLFEEVKEKLNAFVKTGDYEEYLKRHLQKLTISEKGIFEVRENDLSLMKKLLAAKGCRNEVRIGYFAIGGFRYIDAENRLEYSCILEEKRQEAISWFRDHSGFKAEEEDHK